MAWPRDAVREPGLSDLQETAQPQLVEIYWSGEPIDMIQQHFDPGRCVLTGLSDRFTPLRNTVDTR
jgi:hypothetical protein